MLVALVPPLAITAYNTLRWQYFIERDSREEALAAARLVAAELAQIVEGSRQLMTAMGRHPAVPDNEAECVSYFKAVIAGLPAYREAAVIGPDGKFVCSTVAIPPTLDVSDRLYFYGPMQTGELTVGTLVQGRVTRSNSIHISMPFVKRDGTKHGVIVIILNPERVAQDLSARPWRTNHRVTVLDREGSLVFTIPQQGEEDARAIAKAVLSTARISKGGVMQAPDARGRPQILGFAPLEEAPSALDHGRLHRSRYRARRGSQHGLAQHLVRACRRGARRHRHGVDRQCADPPSAQGDRRGGESQGARRGGGQIPKLDPRTDIGQLSAALARMSNSIDALLEQKTFLLRELQHRVMNSLNLLLRACSICSAAIPPTPTRAMSLPRARTASSRSAACTGNCIRPTMPAASSSPSSCRSSARTARMPMAATGTGIEVDAEPMQLSGSKAVALAVLTHELITNVLKHAYGADETGPIFVSLKRAENGSSGCALLRPRQRAARGF